MPVGQVCSRHRSGHYDIVHQAERDRLLAFQRGAWTACWQRQDLPRPERRQQPLNGVPLGVPTADDISRAVYTVSTSSDNFAGDGDIGVGETDAVEFHF